MLSKLGSEYFVYILGLKNIKDIECRKKKSWTKFNLPSINSYHQHSSCLKDITYVWLRYVIYTSQWNDNK